MASKQANEKSPPPPTKEQAKIVDEGREVMRPAMQSPSAVAAAAGLDEPERRLITRKRVEVKSGLKGASLTRAIERGVIPEGLLLGPSTVRWWEHEVDAALAALPRGKGQKRVRRQAKMQIAAPPPSELLGHNGGPPMPLDKPRPKRRSRKASAAEAHAD